MTEPIVALREYLRKMGLQLDGDFLREGITVLTKLLMEWEVSEQIGAERYQHSDERQTHRNGYRDRAWETRVGEIPLRVPKLRQGTYFRFSGTATAVGAGAAGGGPSGVRRGSEYPQS